MFKKTGLSLFFIFSVFSIFAQKTIKGIVIDGQTKQPIPGATVAGDNHSSAVANDNGEFEWNAGSGLQKIIVSSIGYLDKIIFVKEGTANILVLLESASYRLNTVQVTGWSTTKKDNQLDVAQSVGILGTRDFNRNNGLSLENSLNLIPGVNMQSRSDFGGQRIIIRGYGNNTNFNGQGYQVFLNNIPITDATGTTILDDVDFSTLGKTEIFKGPESSLYGSGIAGVVNLYTLKPQPNQTRVVEENTVGSNGLYRNNTRIETAGSHSALFFNYGHQAADGFRTNSASRKDYAQFSGDFFINERNTLSTYFSYANSHEELAGELDSAHFYGRQKWSDPAYLANKSRVDIESIRAGISDNYKIDEHFSSQTTIFTNGYTLYQPFARGLSDNQAFTFGGRTGFVYAAGEGERAVHGILGAQFQKTLAFNKSYGLSNDTLGGIRGDLQNASMTYNIFTEWKVNLPGRFIATGGGSFNFIEFGITDMLANSANPAHANQSGYKRFSPVFTPRISLLKMLDDHTSVYADVSTGYTPPATSQVIIAAIGSVNTGLKPEKGIQYEIGAKGDLIHKTLSYQLALFDMEISDKIISATVPASGTTPTYTYYLNAGKQQNLGGELSLSYTAIEDKQGAISLLRPFLTYTYSSFKYKDFALNKQQDYSNNKVAGVAPHVLNIGVDLETNLGFYAYLTYRYMDKTPYTFDNLNYAKSFNLLNGKIGYRKVLGNHFSLDVSAGGDNLLSTTIYSFLFFSPTLSSQTDPHFIPAPYNTSWYGSARLAYTF